MRPLFLAITAFGTFHNRVEMDLARLCQGGVFRVRGEMGVGKTTLCHAMAVALYGTTYDGHADLAQLRCQSAAAQTQTSVALTFALGAETYRITRKLQAQGGAAWVPSGMIEQQIAGVWTPILERETAQNDAQLTAQVQNLLGLSHGQFGALTLLQGGLATALQSESTCCAQLTALFGVQQWAQAAAHLQAQVQAQQVALDEATAAQQARLTAAGHASIANFAQAIELLAERKAAATQAAEQAQAALIASTAALQQAQGLANRFAQQQELQRKRQKLRENAQYIAQLHILVDFAVLRQTLADYVEVVQKFDHARDWKNMQVQQLRQLQADQTTAQAACDLAQQAWERQREKVQAYEQLRKQKSDHEYAQRCRAQIYAYRIECDRLCVEKTQLLHEYIEHTARESQVQQQFAQTQAYNTARTLQKAESCPICGSVEHAKKPKKPKDQMDHQQFSEYYGTRYMMQARIAQVDAQIEQYSTHIREEEKRLMPFGRTMHGEQRQLQQKIEQAQGACTREKTCKENLERERSNLTQIVQTITQTQAEIDRCTAEMVQWEASRTALGQQLDAHDPHGTLRNTISPACAQDMRPAAQLQAEIDAHLAQQTQVEAQLQAISGALAGQIMPAVEQLQIQQTLCEQALLQAQQAVQRLEDAQKEQEERYQQCAAAQKSLDADQQAHEKLATFAQAVCGQNGVHAYVLGGILQEIITETNALLHVAGQGRYQLHMLQHATLTLAVFDHSTGDSRSLHTLSSGEKFAVSLAFSMALLGKAHAHANALPTLLWVDEGIASLDGAAQQGALRMLAHAKRLGISVGVIARELPQIAVGVAVQQGAEGGQIQQFFAV